MTDFPFRNRPGQKHECACQTFAEGICDGEVEVGWSRKTIPAAFVTLRPIVLENTGQQFSYDTAGRRGKWRTGVSSGRLTGGAVP